jgi:hypothetical protein
MKGDVAMSENEVEKEAEESRRKTEERAYAIWEAEGRPHGCDLDHWLKAEAEITGSLGADAIARSRKPPAGSTAKAQPAQES